MIYDVLVVGAGAAGMTAAVSAAENGALTLLCEPNEKVGRKLAITGKGRCNLTNNTDIDTVLKNIPKNPRFMYSALNAFSPRDVMDFFEREGVPLKTERGNRVFPVSDKAYDIVDALFMKLKKLNVEIKRCRVLDIKTEDGKAAGAVTDAGVFAAKAVVIASGGLFYPLTGSIGDGYKMAEKLGHTVTRLKPALVPLETEGGCAEMAGLSLKNVVFSVRDNTRKKTVFSEQGEMLFTHFGISGPLVLSASSYMDEITPGRYTGHIDLKPALDTEKLELRILRDFDERKNLKLANALRKLLPEALIAPVTRQAGTDPGKQAAVKDLRLGITSYRPIEEAIITDGGISVKEIDPKTMMSKLVPGLFFAGELIDVSALTGGFNLQTAFSTGHAAGISAAVYSLD